MFIIEIHESHMMIYWVGNFSKRLLNSTTSFFVLHWYFWELTIPSSSNQWYWHQTWTEILNHTDKWLQFTIHVHTLAKLHHLRVTIDLMFIYILSSLLGIMNYQVLDSAFRNIIPFLHKVIAIIYDIFFGCLMFISGTCKRFRLVSQTAKFKITRTTS